MVMMMVEDYDNDRDVYGDDDDDDDENEEKSGIKNQ